MVLKENNTLITLLKVLSYIGFFMSLVFILYITLIDGRIVQFHYQYELVPLMSYVKWIRGNSERGIEIVLNIVLFIPFGFFLYQMSYLKFDIGHPAFVGLCGGLFSLAIELCQLLSKVGIFEVDDVINNSIGAIIGLTISLLLTENKKVSYSCLLCVGLSALFIVFEVATVFFYQPKNSIVFEKEFYFGVDDLVLNDDSLLITGVCYVIDDSERDYILLLYSETSDYTIQLSIDKSIANNDLHNNTNVIKGEFVAEANLNQIDFDDIYQIQVDWNGVGLRNTGVYLHNCDILYADDEMEFPDTNDPYINRIASNGILLYHNDKYDCYIYQLQNSLYYLLGPSFPFDADGETLIQLQRWENSPNGSIGRWSGFVFEKKEIDTDLSKDEYRIAKADLSEQSEITCILTGYYIDDNWLWKKYLRPVRYDNSRKEIEK